MPIINQKYALVTSEGWLSLLSEKWPDAPQCGDYRLLVFAGADLPNLEAEYSSAEFKFLEASETIEQMELNVVGPFICSLEQAREIVSHFASDGVSINGN